MASSLPRTFGLRFSDFGFYKLSHPEQPGSLFTAQCEGWWEQAQFGRQPMIDLSLQFRGDEVYGNGRDIIGLFTLRGTINAGGEVALLKHYLGQHAVHYTGHYDGEGVLAGEWRIFTDVGRWAIKFKSAKTA